MRGCPAIRREWAAAAPGASLVPPMVPPSGGREGRRLPLGWSPSSAALLILAWAFATFAPVMSSPAEAAEIDIEAEADVRLIGGGSADSFDDLNGDGIGDILVVTWARGSWSNKGEVILGRADLGGTIDPGMDADLRIASDTSYFSLPAGDVNGDSFSDVMLCSPWPPEPSMDLDAYVIFGRSITPPESWTVPGDADVTLTDVSGGSRVTFWGTGDINGDGYTDVGVKTEGYGVVLGSASMDEVVDTGAADVEVALTSPQGMPAWYASMLSDVNGDGCDEIVMSCVTDSDSWEARVWLGDSSLSPPITITPDDAQLVLLPRIDTGSARIRGGGDVNGDGIGDMLVSLPGSEASEAYVVFGQLGYEPRTIGMEDADVTFTHSWPNASRLAIRLAADAGYDGISDVLLDDLQGSYLFAGGPSLGGTVDVAEAELSFSSGYEGCAAGDFNGDGHTDFLFEKLSYPGEEEEEFAGLFGPFFPAGYVQAKNASGSPGEEDVPVEVGLESTVGVAAAAISFLLRYDESVLLPPVEGDVWTGIAGMELTADVSVPGEVWVELTSSSGDDITITRHEELAVIEFDVAQVAPGTCELVVESVSAQDQYREAVDVVAGPPATFTGLLIKPDSPVVYTEEYVNFLFTAMWLVDNPRYVWWSLPVADSGGSIRSCGTGMYQAGPIGGVVDQVMVQYEHLEGTTEVTVLDGSRPKGTAGPATTMDVDGGGVGLSDVLLILRYVVGMGTLSPAQQDAADFDCDGDIGLDDALNALRVVVGLEPIV